MLGSAARACGRIAGAVLLAGLLACGAETPDVIYLGANVVTMDPERPRAEAVAIAGERIVGVGSDEEMRALAGGRTRLVGLEGRTVVPGFVDAHSHFSLAGELGAELVDLRPPPIGSVDGIPAIQEALRKRAAETPPGEWILAMGWDEMLLPEQRRLTREDLDAVSTEHPILAFDGSLQLATASSRALGRAGVGADTPQPPGGRIAKDPATGAPTGVLEGLAAIDPLLAMQPEVPLATKLARLERAADRYARAGFTTAQEGRVDEAGLELLFRADDGGALPIRVVALPLPPLAMRLANRELAIGLQPGARLSIGAVTIIADGSIRARTAYLREPYHTPPDADPEWRGYPQISREELARSVADFYAGEFQVAIQASGDAAIDEALAAIDAAATAHPHDDARPVLVHARMSRPDQLDEMARLGVVPSFSVLQTRHEGDRHQDVFLGPARASGLDPARSAAERGIPYTMHADAPVVPLEPLRLMQWAVMRQTSDDTVLGAAERVSAEDALRAITLNAARQHFLEDDRGSITPGKLADLVVLDADPLTVDPALLHEIGVVRTIVGGETVYLR